MHNYLMFAKLMALVVAFYSPSTNLVDQGRTSAGMSFTNCALQARDAWAKVVPCDCESKLSNIYHAITEALNKFIEKRLDSIFPSVEEDEQVCVHVLVNTRF